ncbi:MAG: hypothetical protein E7556_07465 [Ruminococcaceae bacterium]|nr:hypothetical protein [Oscillospiraceae bacterium]
MNFYSPIITIADRRSRNSAFSTQHSALSIQHSAFSTQHSALSIQHSAFSTSCAQHSAFLKLIPSTSSISSTIASD